jgi:Spy/CpxP family protein refolding chaperone
MKTRIRKTMMLALSLAILGIGSTFAQPGSGYGRGQGQGPGFMKGQWPCAAMFANVLDLSDEQQDEIVDLRTEHLKQVTNLRNQAREKRARLKTLTTGDNYNESEVNQVIDELGTIRTSIMKERTSHKQDIRSLLTEEQRVVFDARMGRRGMHSKMGNHHGRYGTRMGFGPGQGPCKTVN